MNDENGKTSFPISFSALLRPCSHVEIMLTVNVRAVGAVSVTTGRSDLRLLFYDSICSLPHDQTTNEESINLQKVCMYAHWLSVQCQTYQHYHYGWTQSHVV